MLFPLLKPTLSEAIKYLVLNTLGAIIVAFAVWGQDPTAQHFILWASAIMALASLPWLSRNITTRVVLKNKQWASRFLVWSRVDPIYDAITVAALAAGGLWAACAFYAFHTLAEYVFRARIFYLLTRDGNDQG